MIVVVFRCSSMDVIKHEITPLFNTNLDMTVIYEEIHWSLVTCFNFFNLLRPSTVSSEQMCSRFQGLQNKKTCRRSNKMCSKCYLSRRQRLGVSTEPQMNTILPETCSFPNWTDLHQEVTTRARPERENSQTIDMIRTRTGHPKHAAMLVGSCKNKLFRKIRYTRELYNKSLLILILTHDLLSERILHVQKLWRTRNS